MRLVAGILLTLALGVGHAQAPNAPRPPCAGAAPVPAYGPPDAAPAVAAWTRPSWTAPDCLGWPAQRFRLVVALAASFRHAGSVDALLARFGAISSLRGLRYWSVTDKAWRELITDAAALSGFDGQSRRADFSPAELRRGGGVFFEQTEGRSAAATSYRMQVLEAGPDRVVIRTENVTAVRAMLVTLFPPGTLRATYLLERRGPELWGFYAISSVSTEASALASLSRESYLNRAAALYSHFVGIPTGRHPPPAP